MFIRCLRHFTHKNQYLQWRAYSGGGPSIQGGMRVSNEPETTATHPSMKRLLEQVKWSWDIYILDDGRARIRTPGITLYDMDRFGLPRFENVIRLMIMSGFAFHQPLNSSGATFHAFSELHKDNSYVVTMRGKATQMLYDEKLRKSPLDIVYELEHVGKQSWTSKISLYNKDEIFLAEAMMRHVYIDTKTWLPQSLPQWWIDKYSKHVTGSQKELVAKPLKRPLSATPRYSRVVSWTETDFYNHTNFSVYINMCVDAASFFVSKNLYPTISETVLNRGIESMECLFLGETFFNDPLEIYSWEKDENTLQFDITRDEQSLFQLTFTYFKDVSSRL